MLSGELMFDTIGHLIEASPQGSYSSCVNNRQNDIVIRRRIQKIFKQILIETFTISRFWFRFKKYTWLTSCQVNPAGILVSTIHMPSDACPKSRIQHRKTLGMMLLIKLVSESFSFGRNIQFLLWKKFEALGIRWVVRVGMGMWGAMGSLDCRVGGWLKSHRATQEGSGTLPHCQHQQHQHHPAHCQHWNDDIEEKMSTCMSLGYNSTTQILVAFTVQLYWRH